MEEIDRHVLKVVEQIKHGEIVETNINGLAIEIKNNI
jgi:hypothetical protein